jgi:hypothetical protein
MRCEVVESPSGCGWWIVDEETRFGDEDGAFETRGEAQEALAALRDGDWR